VRVLNEQPELPWQHGSAQEAMKASSVIQDAASMTNDVAALCNRSTKLMAILHGIQTEKRDRANI